MASNLDHQATIILENVRSHNHDNNSEGQFLRHHQEGGDSQSNTDRDKQKNSRVLSEKTFPIIAGQPGRLLGMKNSAVPRTVPDPPSCRFLCRRFFDTAVFNVAIFSVQLLNPFLFFFVLFMGAQKYLCRQIMISIDFYLF
jgi:hypothetical protein